METSNLVNYTQEQVESFYQNGVISADQWEGYMHAWATTAPRFADWGAWERHEFATAQAERIAVSFGCCAVTR